MLWGGCDKPAVSDADIPDKPMPHLSQGAEPAVAAAPAPAPVPTPDPERIFLNRMLGLANLYYIDPEDQEIVEELRQVRQQVAERWLQAREDQLEALFAGEFGQRYRTLVRCGVQKEPLTLAERQFRDGFAPRAANIADPDGLKAMLAALLYYTPGNIRIDQPERILPAWLAAEWAQLLQPA